MRRVHQLRVALRQASTMLDVFQPLIDSQKLRQMRRTLRRVRRAAGNVLEWDVLRGLLTRQTMPDSGLRSWVERRVDNHRRRTGRRFLRAVRKFRPRRFERQVLELGRNLPWRLKGSMTLGQWSRQMLAHGVQQLEAAASGASRDVKSLHQLRIAAKRLRYMLHLLPNPLDPPLADELRRTTARLQEHLGAINDLACQIGQLAAIAKQRPHRRSEALNEFLVVRRVGLELAIEEFFRNW